MFKILSDMPLGAVHKINNNGSQINQLYTDQFMRYYHDNALYIISDVYAPYLLPK